MAMTPDEAGYVQALEAKVLELEAQIANLEVEIKRLRQEKGLPSGVREGLTFDNRTGTHVDGSKKHFCTVCLNQDKRWELRVEPHGFRCMICKKYYPDPDRPERYDGGGDSDSWLAR
ncbi:MAG: bZIP transcription factor [Pseudomonadota bacterium]